MFGFVIHGIHMKPRLERGSFHRDIAHTHHPFLRRHTIATAYIVTISASDDMKLKHTLEKSQLG